MFRTQNNVPNNYIDQSRDFQLICRLYDIVYNNLRYNIDTMININDPLKINDRFLSLLATKIGFITNKNIEVDLLRYILSSFHYALKYKGSIQGIEYVVATLLRFEGKEDPIVEITYNHEDNESIITIPTSIDNIDALDEYLKYILPSGCTYSILIVDPVTKSYSSTMGINDKLNISTVNTSRYSSVSEISNANINTVKAGGFPEKYATTYPVTQVIGSEDNVIETQPNVLSTKTKARRKNAKN